MLAKARVKAGTISPAEIIDREKAAFLETMKDKPANVAERAVEGRLQKLYEEVALLSQPFIKNSELTIRDLITEKIAKLRENIRVRRFVRYEVGGA